jgi:hypothetical protein
MVAPRPPGTSLRALPKVIPDYICFPAGCRSQQVVIQHIEDAHMQLDTAISEALLRRKPVYIEVACECLDGGRDAGTAERQRILVHYGERGVG